jgi:hypothetical protein
MCEEISRVKNSSVVDTSTSEVTDLSKTTLTKQPKKVEKNQEIRRKQSVEVVYEKEGETREQTKFVVSLPDDEEDEKRTIYEEDEGEEGESPLPKQLSKERDEELQEAEPVKQDFDQELKEMDRMDIETNVPIRTEGLEIERKYHQTEPTQLEVEKEESQNSFELEDEEVKDDQRTSELTEFNANDSLSPDSVDQIKRNQNWPNGASIDSDYFNEDYKMETKNTKDSDREA